jgi:prevent-host-death family protein
MSWSVQDAKARFSELLETSVKEGPQIVTKRGVETAVLVPIEEWRRLQQRAPNPEEASARSRAAVRVGHPGASPLALATCAEAEIAPDVPSRYQRDFGIAAA